MSRQGLHVPYTSSDSKSHPALPSPEQGGFQKQSGCVESLWTLTALIDCSVAHLKKSGQRAIVYTVFCDTKEAFDSVWRDGLYFLLHAYGVRGKLLRFIAAWHTGATATGQWYNAESQPIEYSQGVRQGCVLAPVLYAVFINPLFGDPLRLATTPSLRSTTGPLLVDS